MSPFESALIPISFIFNVAMVLVIGVGAEAYAGASWIAFVVRFALNMAGLATPNRRAHRHNFMEVSWLDARLAESSDD